LLIRFVQSSAILTDAEIAAKIAAAGIDTALVGDVINLFVQLTFIGLEVTPNRFEFLYDEQDAAKIAMMADNTAATINARRFRIHPAFHAYLEIRGERETPAQLSIGL